MDLSLNIGFGPLRVGLGSVALANILYNMDTFNVTIEENLFPYSEEFDNVSWAKNAVGITANATTAPDSSTTADLFIPTATTNYHYILDTIDYVAGVSYNTSIYVKAKEFDTFSIVHADADFSYKLANFNLTTLATSGTMDNITITDVGNGWYRLSASAIPSISGVGAAIRFTHDASWHTPNGTDGIYIWGAQTTSTATVQPYVKTTTSLLEKNLRTIDNAGSEGATADGAMYGSNHIYLGATQSVDYVTVNTGDYAYFDVTTKAHVKGTAAAATTTISTPTHHSNFFSLKAGKSISAGDLTALDANPADIARMVNSVATIGTYSFTLADIEAFYPGNEGLNSGAYLHEAIVGKTDIITGDSSTFDTTVGSWVSVGSGTMTWQSDSTGLATNNLVAFSGVKLPLTIPSNNTVYAFTFDASNVVGSPKMFFSYNGGGAAIAGFSIYTVVNGSHVFFFTPTNFSLTANDCLVIRGDTTAEASVKIDNIKLWKFNGVPITNYASTSRTAYKNTNYGASNFLYTQDATGGLTGMADSNLIGFNGDSRYIDTGLIPPSDSAWEMDIVLESVIDGDFHYSGYLPSTVPDRLYIGVTNTGKLRLNIAYSLIDSVATYTGLHHIRVEYDGAGGGNFVIDNVTTTAFSSSGYVAPTVESFFIGMLSRTRAAYLYPHSKPIGQFIYESRTRTAEERTAAYDAAKLLYPTLP